MFRAVVILVLALALSACDVVATLKDGMQQAQAVESDLEQSTGVKPRVGFNWHNGHLASVTVLFPSLYATKPLTDLAGLVRAAVTKEFKQTPDAIVLSFALTRVDRTERANCRDRLAHWRKGGDAPSARDRIALASSRYRRYDGGLEQEDSECFEVLELRRA